MISHNDNTGREFATFREAMEALALDACVIFVLRKMKGQAWRLDVRRPKP